MELFKLGQQSRLVLDTSGANLKVAVGGYNAKAGLVQVEKAEIVPLEVDTITDGEISDVFALTMALKHAVAKLEIVNKEAIVTTDGAFVYTRDLELPIVKDSQLNDMVSYEVLGENNNQEMSVEHIILGKIKDAESGAEKYKIRAMAIPVGVATAYRDLLTGANLIPSVLDVNPNALRKLFSSGMINGSVNVSNSKLLLVELGSVATTVAVLENGFPLLTRRLQFGHSNIRQVVESIRKMQGGVDAQSSIARRLNLEKSEEDSSTVAISDIDVWHESLADQVTLQSAVNVYFKSLVDAITRTAQFTISRFHIDSINECFIYGSGSAYVNISKELSRHLGMQVEVLNSISTVAGPDNFDLPQFINCCGALIRED